MKNKFFLLMMGAVFLSVCSASAHISYLGRNLGTWTYSAGNWSVTGNSGNLTNGNVSVTVKNISKDYGWAKAANTDSGDTHDGGWFKLTVSGAVGTFVITATGGTTNSTSSAGVYPFDNSGPRFLPAFTVYSGLAVAEAHEGVLDTLANSTIANDEGASGELLYVGHAADGTSAIYGSNPDIEGDGVSDGVVKKTFTLPTGNYSIFVGGGNNGGSDLGNYGVNLSIKTVLLPVITSNLIKTGIVGEEISYTITATNNATSYNAQSLPDGLLINTSTGVISGIPTSSGTSNINLTATNDDGATGSATLVMTISQPLPVINSPINASGAVDVFFEYQITATLAPNSFGAVGLPAGLTVNPSSGLISGTPTQSGLFASTISASNGNGTGSRSLEITILPQAPVITSAATANGLVGSSFSHQITASNNPTSYSVSGTLPGGLSLNATSGLISGTPSTAGNATVTISAINSGGSGSAELFIEIAEASPLSPPEIISALTTSGRVGSAFSYKILGSNSPTLYSLLGILPQGLTFNATTGRINGTPTEPGDSILTIGASNSGGSTTQSLAIQILPLKPIISSTASVNGTIGSAFSHQITANNNPTSYSVSGTLPAGLSLNATSGLISGTPSAVGNATVSVIATNAGGSGNQSLTLHILSQVPPNISSTATVNGTVGSAFSHQITASNNPTSYSVSETLPAGLSLNATSGLISGTPSVAGNATVTVIATNAGGSGNQSLTLQILAQVPVITSAATVNGTVGSAFSHQITASNSPTSYSVSGFLPAGLSLNATSGLISGTPTAAGNATVMISATNAGGAGNKSLTFRILAPVPAITSTATANGTVGSAFSHQITANNTPTSYSVEGTLPNGLSLNATSGLISGTPSAAGNASVTVIATNAGGSGSQPLAIQILALQSEPTDPNEPSGNPNPPGNSSPSPTSGGASSSGGPSESQKSGKALSTKKAKGNSKKKSKNSSKKAKGNSAKKAKKKSK